MTDPCDSGYLTNLRNSSFSFEGEDVASLTGDPPGIEPTVQDPRPSQVQPVCHWAIEEGNLYKRRKRSFSCPASTSSQKPTIPTFLRSQSVHGAPERSDEIAGMNRNVETQTVPVDGTFCDGCLRILGDQLSRENPILPGTVAQPERPVAVVQPWFRHNADWLFRRWHNIHVVGGGLRVLADDFDRNHVARGAGRNPIVAANEQVLQAAFVGIQFANGAIFGAFAAVPLPPWAHELIQWVFGLFNP